MKLGDFSKKKLGGGGAGPDLVDHPPGCSPVVKLSVLFHQQISTCIEKVKFREETVFTSRN